MASLGCTERWWVKDQTKPTMTNKPTDPPAEKQNNKNHLWLMGTWGQQQQHTPATETANSSPKPSSRVGAVCLRSGCHRSNHQDMLNFFLCQDEGRLCPEQIPLAKSCFPVTYSSEVRGRRELCRAGKCGETHTHTQRTLQNGGGVWWERNRGREKERSLQNRRCGQASHPLKITWAGLGM